MGPEASEEDEVYGEEEESFPAFRLLAERLSSKSEPGTSKIVEVRRCPCAPHLDYFRDDFYCPAQLSYCAIAGSYYSNPADPVCLNVHNEEIFVRSIWPIILIWFALALIFCICTWAGRNACDFMIGTLFPCWNQLLFDAVCNRDSRRPQPEQDIHSSFWGNLVHERRGYIQDRYRGIVGRARVAEDGVANNGFEYEFRTRIYKAEEDTDDMMHENEPDGNKASERTTEEVEEEKDGDGSEAENAASCSICFLAFEDGERVGDIDCGHVFHVECLKGWLTRRNVCPLCMQEGIAKPKGQRLLQRRPPTVNSGNNDNNQVGTLEGVTDDSDDNLEDENESSLRQREHEE